MRRAASQVTPPTHRRERSLDIDTLRFIGDTVTEVTSQSASNTPIQRRKTAADGPISFSIGEAPLANVTKDSVPKDQVISGDLGDDVTKGSLGELLVTRKGSLKRGESEDTINGDDQSGPGDNVTLSEETVHDLEKDGKIVTDAIEPMGGADVRSEADKMSADVEWAPAARYKEPWCNVFDLTV